MRRILLCCFILLSLSLFPTQPSLAKSPKIKPVQEIVVPVGLPAECNLYGTYPTEPERWMAVWNFDNLTGCLLFTGTPKVVGEIPPIIGHKLIPCTSIGDISFAQGAAFFHGNAYLTCDFSISDDPLAPDLAYNDFWIYAQKRLHNQLGSHPIITHPDFSLASTKFTDGLAQLNWSFQRTDGNPYQVSSPRYFTTVEDHIRTESCFVRFNYCIGDGLRADRVGINGQTINVDQISQRVLIRQKPTTLYIGYNPTTNAYFQGVLGMLIVDPAIGKDPTTDSLPPDPQ